MNVVAGLANLAELVPVTLARVSLTDAVAADRRLDRAVSTIATVAGPELLEAADAADTVVLDDRSMIDVFNVTESIRSTPEERAWVEPRYAAIVILETTHATVGVQITELLVLLTLGIAAAVSFLEEDAAATDAIIRFVNGRPIISECALVAGADAAEPTVAIVAALATYDGSAVEWPLPFGPDAFFACVLARSIVARILARTLRATERYSARTGLLTAIGGAELVLTVEHAHLVDAELAIAAIAIVVDADASLAIGAT